MIIATDYDSGITETLEFKIPDKVESFTVSVDGGRIYISVDDLEVYSNCYLRDGCVEITKG